MDLNITDEYIWIGTIDRTGWPEGPWDKEPEDKVEWEDPTTGFPCIAKRVMDKSGHWCGYVGVPPQHPLHGVHYSECLAHNCEETLCRHDKPQNMLRVHGGVTFTGECQEDKPIEEAICHRTAEDEEDDIWWIGFDCAHAGDFRPGHVALMTEIYRNEPPPASHMTWDEEEQAYDPIDDPEDYVTLQEVQEECNKLARQLAYEHVKHVVT